MTQAPSTLSITSLASVVAVVSLSVSCSSASSASVASRLEIINQTKSALAAGSITAVEGTYGALCDGRDAAGTDTWTISVSGGPAGDELSVRKNDTDCVLTVANIVTAGGEFVGAPVIPLSATDTYAGSSSAFALAASPLAFYGNAKIDALTYAADFTITLLVSDAPAATDEGNKAATFATQTGTVSASTLPASDYTISFATFGLEKDVNDVVQSVSGYAQLTAHSVTGQDYAIYEGALTGASTLVDVEAAYAGASTTGLLSALTTLQLPATGFGLVTVDLDTSTPRTVIIRNTDQGVSSYQLLLITFTP